MTTILLLSTIGMMVPAFAYPGEADPNAPVAKSASNLIQPLASTGGLVLVEPDPTLGVTFFGEGSFSADALGQDGGGGTIQAEIPAGSTVEQAYLYATTFTTDVTSLDIDFDGTTYTLSELTHSNYDGCCNLQSYKHTSPDLVNQISAKFATDGPGIIDFVIGNDPFGVDGVTLVVIYSNPSLPQTSIALLDGGVSVDGELTTIGLAEPLDKSIPGFSAIMSLSIGFSASSVSTDPHGCGTGQVNYVDVNGARLTSCAGDHDDGYHGNGGLVTTGGVGDNIDNPPDPNGPGGEDDELYNIESFLADGDTSIILETSNPSDNDNIYALIIELTAKASVGEICGDGIDNDGDGQIDEGCEPLVEICGDGIDNDGDGQIDEGCNTAPTANDDAISTDEDTPVDGQATADDTEGDPLTFALVDDVSNGVLEFNEDGSFTYTPNEDYFGSDSFTFTANDGEFDSNVATITIEVSAVNDDPVCSDATSSISMIWPPNHKMVTIDFEMSATDVDGDETTVSISSIYQDEPTNDLGDGDKSPDADLENAQVRAERSGLGDGRIYVVTVIADDGNGGTCEGSFEIGVPHDKKDTPIDSIDRYDSTEE